MKDLDQGCFHGAWLTHSVQVKRKHFIARLYEMVLNHSDTLVSQDTRLNNNSIVIAVLGYLTCNWKGKCYYMQIKTSRSLWGSYSVR